MNYKNFLGQSFSYAGIGMMAMLLDFLILYLFVEFVKMNYLVSVILAFIIAAIFNFFAQKKFTFKDKNKNYFYQLSFFGLIGVIGMGINVVVVFVSVHFFGLWYMSGKLIATVIAFIWNFFANKLITFR
jgi:putative flippase GtrA